jgi:hypothetical protein
MLDISMGRERVRVWPKKRGKAKTAEAKKLQDRFRQANWACKYWDPRNIVSVDQMRKGTPVLIRDLQIMMMYGRFAQFSLSNGQRIYSMQARQDVSDSLDTISPIPGSMLWRAADGWRYIIPPTTATYVLTVGADLTPDWEPPVGGGGVWDVSTPPAASFTLQSGDGTQLILTDDTDVGLTVNTGAPAAGQIGRIAVRALSDKTKAWRARAKILSNVPGIGNCGVGLYLKDSISGRLTSFDVIRETGIMGIFNWASLASFSSSPASFSALRPIYWVEAESDGTNLTFRYSESGKIWVDLLTVGLSSFLTNKPDLIGFGSNTNRTTGARNQMTVNYLVVDGPGA